MTLVRMLKYYGSLNKGERAGFSDEEAQKLIEKGIAERLEPIASAPATIAVESTDPPVETPPVADPPVEQSPSQHKEDPPAATAGGEVAEPTGSTKKR